MQLYGVTGKEAVVWCCEVMGEIFSSEFFQHSLRELIAVLPARMISRGCFSTIRPRTLTRTPTRTNYWKNSPLNYFQPFACFLSLASLSFVSRSPLLLFSQQVSVEVSRVFH